MRVVLLLVLLMLMSITPPTLAVTTATATTTTLPVEPDRGPGGQPGEPGGRPTATTTKTDGPLTASINGTSFTTNQTILVNGTIGRGASGPSSGVLYVELRDPTNAVVLHETIQMTTRSVSDTPFSYRLVAGDLARDSPGPSRTVYMPMNQPGQNYTLTVGFDDINNSTSNNTSSSRPAVQFVFAYEHLLDDAAVAAGGGEEPTTSSSTTTPPPPTAPAPAGEDDDDDDDNGDDDDNNEEDDDDDRDDDDDDD
jgi:hypothetical protein